ncbi:MAG: ABC transporter substrate-binding protein [Candidatus Dormibacteraeota bacterium]|nr:ABC transporter substrate-binding protein [Candidatus Dormibacteraeota bacterium]
MTAAEIPNDIPDYIFPMDSPSFASNANYLRFENQFWVPLYWIGKSGKPVLNTSLSLANPPTFSNNNTVVTIRLKRWLWSNGKPVTARDVLFWMNLLSAVTDPLIPTIGSAGAPGPGFQGYVPGEFPQNVESYSATGEYELTLRLNGSYNPTWFTYSELVQMFAIPQASWDRLSLTGPVGNYDLGAQTRILAPASANLPPHSYVPATPGTATTGALGVAQFLNQQSESTSTYTTNPLWQVVDGPFRLANYTTSGFVKMVPNHLYSGRPKPRISAFEELPFTSESSEYLAVLNGTVTIGSVPLADVTQAGSLKAKGYAIAPWYPYGYGYISLNYTNPTLGPIFRQLYFRQAFQSLINQHQYIKDILHGYGLLTNSPIPAYPPNNPYESPQLKRGLVYPYSPKRAVDLLKSHGWKVNPGGLTYCANSGNGPGQCGAGIARGQALKVPLIYIAGIANVTAEVEAVQSTMQAQAGIDLLPTAEPEGAAVGTAYATCTYTAPCSNWALFWGGDFTYSPLFFPSGNEILACGASGNAGDYCSQHMNSLIADTNTAPTYSAEVKAMYAYGEYAATQVAHAYQPTTAYQITAYKTNLRGLIPQDPSTIVYPQLYYFAQ